MPLLLHSTRRCPFCIRVRILLHLKGLAYETVEEPMRVWTPWLKEWGSRTGERLRVPVLRVIDDNGKETVYTESNLINLMLDETYGEVMFTPPKDSREYQEMLEWFSWCDEILKPQIDLYKYGKNLQFDKDAHKRHTEELEEILSTLEESLKGKEYLLGELTLADIAIIPFVRQIMRTREGEFDFSSFPNTKRWTLSLIESDWFTDVIMKK